MATVNFIFGIHNHQPVGNFDNVFELAYNHSYLPLIQVLQKHPSIQWNLHSSGVLWDWLIRHKPEYIDKIKEMVEQGRLELLSGGYYEPILSSLPDKDKKGQIKKLNEFIEETFGVTPKGLWLTERVWEPHLPKSLHESGIQYTILDDAHFLSTGVHPDKLTGYYTTDEQGSTVQLFSISKMLRYMIPFAPPDDCMHFFQSFAQKNDHGLLVMADDGEKFGLWPNTFDHVYKNGWLDRFFTMLENHADWIKTWKCGDYIKKYPSKGVVYIPSSSYFEMSEWTLPAEQERDFEQFAAEMKKTYGDINTAGFLRSANWRNFFFKYSESNTMHKKMLYVSNKVNSIDKSCSDTNALTQARNDLYAGQCNCAYWHGVFGGLYMPHLRDSIYRNLIAAESLADELNGVFKKKNFHYHIGDYNCDGSEEVIIEGKTNSWIIAPHKGGSLVEWDFKPECVNLVNVLTRRYESYHEKIKGFSHAHAAAADSSAIKTIHDVMRPKQEGLNNDLNYDWHEKLSFLDHFFHSSVNLDGFSKGQFGEQGNFVLSTYGWRIHEEKNKNSKLKLFCEGRVWVNDEHCPVLINKEFEFFPDASVGVTYTVNNVGSRDIDLWLGIECNLLLDSAHKQKELVNAQKFSWVNSSKNAEVFFEFEHPVDLWKYPIETVSQSEDGYEKTFQGVTIVPHAKFSVAVASSFQLKWKISVRSLKNPTA